MGDSKQNRDWMSLWARKADFATFEPLAHAAMGDPAPLADYIESGGSICPASRAFIADHLRGEVKVKKGNRRSFAQVKKETQALAILHVIKFGDEARRGRKCSDTRALDLYDVIYCATDAHAMIPTETMRTYARKARSRSKPVK